MAGSTFHNVATQTVVRSMDYADLVDSVEAALAAAVTDDWIERSGAPAVVWTGDIATTLVTWLAVAVMRKRGATGLDAVFVEHGGHQDETKEFVKTVADSWDVEFVIVSNRDALDSVQDGGEIPVDALGETNRRALRSRGIDADTVPADPTTPLGRTLLRTIPLDAVVADRDNDALLTGRRSHDITGAVDAPYVERSDDGSTVRVRPLLHMAERDVWRAAMTADLPTNPLYAEGYREIVDVGDQAPPADRPAWKQVLDPGGPRGNGDKGGGDGDEGPSVMQRLREAGS